MKHIHVSDDPFTLINISILDDPRLSWAAKGIAAFVSGQPDDWQLCVADIVKQGADSERVVVAALEEIRKLTGLLRLKGKTERSENEEKTP